MSIVAYDTSPADVQNTAVSLPITASIKVLLIRHGESQSNAGLPTQSTEFVELTDRGNKQAQEVFDYIRQVSLIPDLIITSPYLRSQQTAIPLRYFTSQVKHFMSQERLLKPPEEEWPVQEFTYLASWRSEYSTVQDRRPVVDLFWEIADPTMVDGPGAESFEQFINRTQEFKTELESTKHSTIAVFSHEQFISAFLWLLECSEVTPTTAEMRDYRTYLLDNPIPNGGIVKAQFHKGNGKWTFERITEHLTRQEDDASVLALAFSR